MSRFIFHRDGDGQMYHLAAEHVSNRWKVLTMSVGTLDAMVGKQMRDVKAFLESDRIWLSC